MVDGRLKQLYNFTCKRLFLPMWSRASVMHVWRSWICCIVLFMCWAQLLLSPVEYLLVFQSHMKAVVDRASAKAGTSSQTRAESSDSWELVRGKAEESLQREAGGDSLDESSRPQVDDALRLCGSGSGSQEPSEQSQRVWEGGRLVKQAMQIAAEKVGEEHLAAMPDPAFRAQAARWRSGDEGRKFSAVLARFLNGLSTLRPGWQAEVAGSSDPPEVTPLPLTRKTLGNYEPALWWRRWTDVKRFFLVHWRAMWVLLVILCFPKLVATCLAVFLRMVVRLLVGGESFSSSMVRAGWGLG